MSKYKLIALDMDGTLNNDQGEITPKTKEALIKAQEQGAILVLASGRPTAGLKRESIELDLEKHHGLLLSYNGGSVIDITTKKALYEKAIPNDLAKKVLRHLEQFPVFPIVDDGEYIYTNTPDGFQVEYETTGNGFMTKLVDNIADAVDFTPIKILISCPEEILKPLISDISSPFQEDLSFILSAPFYLETTMKGIDKAASLMMICEKLGIQPHEVMAFGDGENDISMIKFAGLGVAMNNARQSVKAIADEITLSNNDDGIAVTLANHFDDIKL